jgi:hypothetical protein
MGLLNSRMSCECTGVRQEMRMLTAGATMQPPPLAKFWVTVAGDSIGYLVRTIGSGMPAYSLSHCRISRDLGPVPGR